LGNKGVVRLGVIETIRGSCDEDAIGGDGFGVILGKGGISHGRGMRSSEDGAVFLIGGNGISSGVGDLFHGVGITGVASLCDGDGVSDWGNGISMESSTIMGGGSYCSIDEYCRRCDPQGTSGNGGVTTRGGSMTGGLGGIGMGTNGDGSTMGGNGAASLGKDDDGWMNSRIMGGGLTGCTGAAAGTDDGASGVVMVGSLDPPEGPGLVMNVGDGDLPLNVLLRPLRNARSPSRNV